MQTMSATYPHERCVPIPKTAFTVAGFRAWRASAGYPDHGRIDLCDGEVLVDMSPERAESHTLVKGEILTVLSGLVRTRELGRIYGDGITFTNEAAGLVTEPDALFFSWQRLDEGTVRGGRPDDDPLGISGAVDWVLEVVSPSSVHKDRRTLLGGYARAGVREYWIVDALGDQIVFDLYVAGPNGFEHRTPEADWRASAVFGGEFRLEQSRDSRGGWQFTLAVR